MPKDFLRCVDANGKMATRKLPNGKYVRLCKDKKGWHQGEVHTKKNNKPRSWIKRAHKKK